MIADLPSGLCFPTVVCPSQVFQLGGGLAQGVASDAAGTIMQAVAGGLTQAASWLIGHVIGLIQSSTNPDLGTGWFVTELKLMEQLMFVAVLPVLMAATIGPILRQDGRRMFRVWGVGLPLSVFSALTASQLAGWALTWTDGLSSMVVGSHSDRLAHQFSSAMGSPAVTGSPLFVQMILAVLALTGGLLVWLELTVRSAGVYVATFFMPLVLVAYIWPATAGLAKRAVQILVSLILSKFVVMASLSLGAAAVTGRGIDAPLSGAAILLMAGYAPFALLRLAPVVEASAIAHLEGMSRRPVRAAAHTATAVAGAPGHPITQLVMSNAGAQAGRADGGGLVAQMVTSHPLPEPAPDFPFPDRSDPAASPGGADG